MLAATFDWTSELHPRGEHGHFMHTANEVAAIPGTAVPWKVLPSKEAAEHYANSPDFQQGLPKDWRNAPKFILPAGQTPGLPASSTNGPDAHAVGVVAPKDAKEDERAAWKESVQKAKGIITAQLDRTGISGEKREEYEKAAYTVVDYMTKNAADLFNANLNGIQFYNNTQEITRFLEAKHQEKLPDGDLIGGFWAHSSNPSDHRGTLHLDGGDNDAIGISTRHIYAHEMSHAIDGAGAFSSHPDWKKAWEEEIEQPHAPLSEYATTSASEGWAEFGRLALTSPREAREFPKCKQFWKERGLM